MPELSEVVVESFAEFKASELEQFRVWLRRNHAAQLRTLLSRPADEMTLETFNHEVWRVETATYLRGDLLPYNQLFANELTSEEIAHLRAAFIAGDLEIHGNGLWGSGTKVFGAQLPEDDAEKLALVHQALEILNGSETPLRKAELINAIRGFGDNIATGLVMVFHPEEFQISNQVSKAEVRQLGFPHAPLPVFEDSVSNIKSQLNADDFIELDWFLYLRHHTETDIPPQPTVWLIRGSETRDEEAINFAEGVVSIGWSALSDLVDVKTLQEIRDLYQERYPNDSDAKVTTQARQVFLFKSELADGDLVLTPLKTRPGFVAVGRVIGPYEFRDEAPFAPEARHTHKIDWLSAGIPLEAFASDLREKLKLPQTVSKINVVGAAAAIEKLVDRERGASIHLVVKWAARYGADTDTKHIAVAEEHGAVWWGLFSSSGSSFRVSEQWVNQLRSQIAAGRDTFVFLAGPTCWSTRLLDVQYDEENVDPALVPGYYGSDGHYHLWIKLTDFQPIERDELVRTLDPVTKPGRALALGNQTNPLIVRFRSTPRVWWVNQGASYGRSCEGGYIWAPMLDKGGKLPEHWRTMRYLRRGDTVINYANTKIRAYSEVLGTAAPSPRPDAEADQAWNDEGLRAELEYHTLHEPISLYDIPPEWRQAEGGPFEKGGNVKQGYLFQVSDDFASKLQRAFPELQLKVGEPADDGGEGEGDEDDEDEPKGLFDLPTLVLATSARKLRISPHILANALAAIQSGKHVIFTGPPGTAKTTLAEVVASVAAEAGLCAGYTLTTATADWTTYETIGGLKPDVKGGLTFQEGHFLEAIRLKQWLVIDELNRSNFDRAFGQLFTVLSGQAVELPYERIAGGGRLALVPEGASHNLVGADVLPIAKDWRVIATMNVFDKSLLFEMSFALMRRFAFIEVPSPSHEDFIALIGEQTGDDSSAAELTGRFLGLRKIKDLGPAVFMDLARFLRARRAIADPGIGQLAFEGFYGYLLPQFEGSTK